MIFRYTGQDGEFLGYGVRFEDAYKAHLLTTQKVVTLESFLIGKLANGDIECTHINYDTLFFNSFSDAVGSLLEFYGKQ